MDSTDINGKKAGTIIITTNRSGGKTSSMLNLSLDYYKKTGRSLLMVFRKKKEMQNVEAMYADVLSRRKDVKEILSIAICDDLIVQLVADGEIFAYGACLKDIDGIKKYSAVFSKVDILVLDEYQAEDGKYLDNEVAKMLSLIISVSRGGGKASRDVQLFLLGNNYTLLNPYLFKFGITMRYKKGMRKIKGKGYCAYFIQIDHAKEEMESNSALEAFRDLPEYRYATESDFWIGDNTTLIEKPKGRTFYICTIKYGERKYGLWECIDGGYIIITKRIIENSRHVYTLTEDGLGSGIRLMKRSSNVWKIIQSSYDDGMIRFENLECKYVMLQFLSKGLYTR